MADPLFGWLTADVLVNSGFGGLVLLGVWLIMTGRLVPKSTHQEVRGDRDAWRKACETEQEARRIQAEQLNKMLEGFKTIDQFIRSLPQPQSQVRGGD